MYTKNAVHRLSNDDFSCLSSTREMSDTVVSPQLAARAKVRVWQNYFTLNVSTFAIALLSPGDAASTISFMSGSRMPVFAPGADGTLEISFRWSGSLVSYTPI